MINVSSILRGVGAGISHALFLSAAIVFDWILPAMIGCAICSILSGIVLNLFLIQKSVQDFFASFVIGIIVSFICNNFLSSFGLLGIIFHRLFPYYGRMSAGIGFAILFVTVNYLVFTFCASFVALGITLGRSFKEDK